MNKLIFRLSLLFLIAGVTFVSCSKDELVKEAVNETRQYEDSKLRENPLGIKFTMHWDEWGRAKKDCGGGGLCNFKVSVTVVIDPYQVPVSTNGNGTFWVDIPVTEEMPLEYDGAFFPIDEDIISQANDGTFFKMESGLYPLNSSIGENGGFRIPLIVRQ